MAAPPVRALACEPPADNPGCGSSRICEERTNELQIEKGFGAGGEESILVLGGVSNSRTLVFHVSQRAKS